MRSTTVTRRALDLAALGGLLVFGAANAGAEHAVAVERRALEEHVRALSSDDLAGRANGSTGLETAAQYIGGQFKTLSLLPAGEQGTYFQRFRIPVGQHVGRDTKAFLRSRAESRVLTYGEDFELLTFSPKAQVSGAVVFVGYGVTATDRGYDDYEGLDVAGKVVLVLRYAPAPFDQRGWHATFVRKAMNASSHGAVAMLLVNPPAGESSDNLVPFGVDVGSVGVPIPVLHVRREIAERLISTGGQTLADLRQQIDDKLAPASFALEGVDVGISVDIEETFVEVENVLGYLPPTRMSEEFQDEHLIIGAHYDHIGLGEKDSRDRRARGKIHNGADDNASGVAGVLELARMFSGEPDRSRGILFAAFAGEELGLKGSEHYVAEPTLPLDRAVGMINLDMIGRLRHDRLYLGGIDLLPVLEPYVERLLRRAGLSVSSHFTAETSSDHASFIRAGIPSLFFFTGLHGDYHKPTDDVEFIDFGGMERVVDVSFDLSEHLLESRERLVLTLGKAHPYAPTARSVSVGEGAYFGVGVDNRFEGEGVRFTYVAPAGPAAKAGLLPGDILLEIDGRAVGSSDNATRLLRELRPGETVNAKVRREDKILRVSVELTSWP